MNKNSLRQKAYILVGKHKQKKWIKSLWVMMSARRKRQGEGIGSEDVRAWLWAVCQTRWPQKALLRSTDHNWGTQIWATTQENSDISLHREWQVEMRSGKRWERFEYWRSSGAVNNLGSAKWKQRNGTIKTAATRLWRKPWSNLLVSEVKRNVWWFVVSHKEPCLEYRV